MRTFKKVLPVVLAAMTATVLGLPATSSDAQAEMFYCKSTRKKDGTGKYCNFLLFDKAFTRHKQVVVAQGAYREVAINGRYDVFCVLVQDTLGAPSNVEYRKQQCKKTDTAIEYKVPIRAMNMRRGNAGFSTDNVSGFMPRSAW